VSSVSRLFCAFVYEVYEVVSVCLADSTQLSLQQLFSHVWLTVTKGGKNFVYIPLSQV
jgi:hypothetical protein